MADALGPAMLTSVQVDALVVMKVIKHCSQTFPTIATGSLVGMDVNGSLEITNSFPFPTPDAATADSHQDSIQSLAAGAPRSKANGAYQNEMVKYLREVNVDANNVGWYTGTSMGNFINTSLIENQYYYQKEMNERTVALVYDVSRSVQGSVNLKAFRLSPVFMTAFKESKFTVENLQKSGLRYQDILIELPITIQNSHLLTSLLHQLPSAPAHDSLPIPDSLSALEKAANAPQPPFDPNLDTLDLSIDPFLEKTCDLLLDTIENHHTELNNHQYYQRSLAREQAKITAWQQKRKSENAARVAAKQTPLPEDEWQRLFKLPQEPSRLELMLNSRQVEQYARQVDGFSATVSGKMFAVKSNLIPGCEDEPLLSPHEVCTLKATATSVLFPQSRCNGLAHVLKHLSHDSLPDNVIAVSMEDSLLCPPRLEHAPTPPPSALRDGAQEDAGTCRAGTRVRWDLRHSYDRLMSRSQSRDGSSGSRDTSPFSSAQQSRETQRPKLTIVTTNQESEQGHTGLQGSSRLRDCVVDVQSLPSGSTTATNSGTPPSALSKVDSLGKLRRTPLLRDTTCSTIGSAVSVKSPNGRWFGWLSSVRVRPDRPIPASPTTPFHLPRRFSRLPSFFTRERLYLPQHLQRRDVFLITITILIAFSFTALGVFAAVKPQVVCSSKFLQAFVDALLPGLFIGAPYTLVVVAIAVSGWGKSWINGRYTPLFYVLAATLGKVVIGALIANVDWTVLAC